MVSEASTVLIRNWSAFENQSESIKMGATRVLKWREILFDTDPINTRADNACKACVSTC